MRLTLQIHDPFLGWINTAELTFLSEQQVRIEYDLDYASKYLGRNDLYALSLTFPVKLDTLQGETPAFLVDLIPQGNALRRLMGRHSITSETNYQQILSRASLASPGNLRILEPWEIIEQERDSYNHQGFSRAQVVNANLNFLEYMEKHGAPVGGTSGAAGGAPKFLLREDFNGRFHADGYLDDSRTKTAWMIKFPFSDSANSKLLIQTEKKYYDILKELPLHTGEAIDIEKDILFIRRFDRIRTPDNRLYYFGLESFYSAHNIATYGTPLTHEDNLQLIQRYSTQPEADICEYLKRDLIFRALSNTDNHGRNTSFIKKDGSITLSPIYDVTAMRFFEGDFIVPLTRWTTENQTMTSRLKWIEQNISIDINRLHQALVEFRTSLQDLESLLKKYQVADEIITRSADDRASVKAELNRL